MIKNKAIFVIAALILLFFTNYIYAQQAELQVKIEPPALIAGSSGEILVTYVFPQGMHQILQEDYFFFEVEDQVGFSFGDLVYPEGKIEDDGFIHLYGQATLTRTITVSPATVPGFYEIDILAGYQLCYDSGACIMPEEVDITAGLEVLPRIEESEIETALPPVESSDSEPILLYLFFALIGGIILNLTPCVLPVLSLRAFTLIRDSQDDKKKITISSLVYSAGILFCFLLLAIIVIALKASGELVGWGFQFQNPTFVLVLTAIIFAFSLALFDVFVITAPDSKVANKMISKRGLAGSFFMGVFAVLLGTPCTAPILGAALAFAFAQPPLLIIAMFSLIGLGMALPFILIAFKPAYVKKLPKPGEWMNILKEIMGFLLLFWAIKMLQVLYYQLGGDALISIIYFLLGLGFAFWIIGRFIRPEVKPVTKIIALIIAILIVIFVGNLTLRFDDQNLRTDDQSEVISGRWQSFSPERIHELREEGVPIFIDFTAKWCTTCYTNELTVLYTSDIQEAFERKGVELFIADFTRYDETIAQWIQSYGRVGVPVYVFYLPGEEEPILLPEIITKRMVFDVLDRIEP
ncbi:MAG: thioredoxin family protein [Candidatus Cloacimonetes bacterium]|nr:thioredoxin family protein [Candidatus Cloacimonadota bacterium]